MKTLFLITATCFFIESCSSPNAIVKTRAQIVKEDSSVIKPIPGLEVPIRTFEVSATLESKIELPNGGSIEFPAHAFVDENGQSVSGSVTIEWQEFHSITDIMFSGIPMAYDSAGVENTLKSGGMFTIEGHQNQQPIAIAQNKSVTVNLASNNEQKAFNFYNLNEASGQWNYETTAEATPNTKLIPNNTSAEIDESKYYTLNIDVAFKRDSFPELQADEILAWEVPKSKITKKQLLGLKSDVCRIKIAGRSGNDYLLAVKNKTGDHLLTAHPVTFESKSHSNERAQEMIKDQSEAFYAFQNLSQQGKLIRTMDISGFGTYNWDCIYHREHDQLIVDMKIPEEKMSELAAFFFVVPEDGIIIPISNKATLNIPKDERCSVIAISTKNTVHKLDYKKLNDLVTNGKSRQLHKLNLSPSVGTLNQASDIATLLEKCV